MLRLLCLSLLFASSSAYLMYQTPYYPLVIPGRAYSPWPRMLTAPAMGLTERLMYETEMLDKMLSLRYEAPRYREQHDTKTTWIERDHDIPATWRESADGKHAVLRVKGFREMTPTASLDPDGITLTIKGEKKVKNNQFKITKDMSVELPFAIEDPHAVRLSLGRQGLLTVKVPLEARAATPEATQLEVELLPEEEAGELPAAGADKPPRAESSAKDEAEAAAALEATLDEKFGVDGKEAAKKSEDEQGEQPDVEEHEKIPEQAAPPTPTNEKEEM